MSPTQLPDTVTCTAEQLTRALHTVARSACWADGSLLELPELRSPGPAVHRPQPAPVSAPPPVGHPLHRRRMGARHCPPRSVAALTDYQVLVVAGREQDTVGKSPSPAAVPAAVFDAIDAHGVCRVLSFTGVSPRPRTSLRSSTAPAHPVDIRSLPGTCMGGCRLLPAPPPSTGGAGGELAPQQVRVVSTARVLTEGVDVPAVDAVCFADERSSVVDIIQAIVPVLSPRWLGTQLA